MSAISMVDMTGMMAEVVEVLVLVVDITEMMVEEEEEGLLPLPLGFNSSSSTWKFSILTDNFVVFHSTAGQLFTQKIIQN